MKQDAGVFWGTGKRKTAIARVRLSAGTGSIVVNGRTLEEYFGRETSRMVVQQPFDALGAEVASFQVAANVRGGGVAAQAVAIRHGITRALLEMTPESRSPLKKAGFITRDPREVERKKYGRHKARKRPQYSKR